MTTIMADGRIEREVKNPDPREAEAAMRTHSFAPADDIIECDYCACRPYNAAATWPCGADVPREIVEVG